MFLRCIFPRKEFVGADYDGNKYYIIKDNISERRFVKYNGPPEASKVPAAWHLWLHHSSNEVPKGNVKTNHIPNLTGTNDAYYPHNNLFGKKSGSPKVSCYKSWVI